MRGIGVLAGMLALAVAAPAQAATAGVSASGVLTYRTTLGETSNAAIACGGGSCTIADPGVVILPLSGCSGLITITCTGVTRRDVVTGAGDDDVALSGSIGGAVDLGGGDDAVDTRNSAPDDVTCGAGTGDRVRADGLDTVDASCESVERNVHVDIGDAAVAESGGTARFVVRLTRATAVPVSVSWATADGSATAPGDYTAASGSLTFPPFTTEREVAVAVVDDAAPEPDETFTVALSGATGAPVGDGAGTATIADDDATGGGGGAGSGAGSGGAPGGTGAGGAATGGAATGEGGDALAAGAGRRARHCVVPRVRGMTVRRATRAITRAGCILIRTKRRKAHVRRGRAVRTSPRAGRRVAHLAFVVLYVSRGRAR